MRQNRPPSKCVPGNQKQWPLSMSENLFSLKSTNQNGKTHQNYHWCYFWFPKETKYSGVWIGYLLHHVPCTVCKHKALLTFLCFVLKTKSTIRWACETIQHISHFKYWNVNVINVNICLWKVFYIRHCEGSIHKKHIIILIISQKKSW